MNLKLQDESWDGSTPSPATNICLSDCDATFSYIIKGDLTSGYVITSVGKSGNATRVVRATIGLKGIFDHAILTKDSLILKSNTIVDGYNSTDPSVTDVEVHIGSQSTSESSIVLNNGVVVDGDVLVGIGGDPETGIKDLGATVSGDKRAATIFESLTQVNPPALTDTGKSITGKGTTITITSADSGIYTDIDLQKGKSDTTLEVSEGDVVLHVTGDIELDQGCEIVVKDGASLTIYVDGDIICREGSGINTEAPPEEASTLKLFATGDGKQILDVKAKSDWTGVIYAPNGDVVLNAHGDAYGSIISDTFEFKNGGDFHYDEALKEATIGDVGVTFAVMRWSEEKVTSSAESTSDVMYQLLERDN